LRTIVRMHRRLPEGYQVEEILVSDCVLAPDVLPVCNDGEVCEFRLLDMEGVWDMVQQDMFTHEAELTILDSMRHQDQIIRRP